MLDALVATRTLTTTGIVEPASSRRTSGSLTHWARLLDGELYASSTRLDWRTLLPSASKGGIAGYSTPSFSTSRSYQIKADGTVAVVCGEGLTGTSTAGMSVHFILQK